MSIAYSIQNIQKELSQGVELIAVSKTKPDSDLMEAYNAGQRHFGENKVQDITEKHETLPKDIKWHFIGHLQTNKVKYIAPFVHLIHAVDSIKLLKEINKRAEQNERTIDCLLQLSIAEEESKFGLSDDELNELLSGDVFKDLKNINVKGLMGMATFTEDETKIRSEFKHLSTIYTRAKESFKDLNFSILSMGMTNDYQIAIEEGSNMVRIGSKIFGERNL